MPQLRFTNASQLGYQVMFSFTPSGPVCISHHRYVYPSKTAGRGYRMKLCYFVNNRFKAVVYYLENARSRRLYLHESPTYARQAPITVQLITI